MNDKGISGRDDLRNVTVAAKSGINYRLLELGFGTNKTDSSIMVNDVELIAKSMVKAIYGRVKEESVESSELYRVQVGAYKDKKNVTNKANELKQLGQDVYIVKY